jgi:hypothetical protein
MRKIVTNQETNVVDIQEVWNYTNVGILWNDTKTKSIIIKTIEREFRCTKG